TIGPSDPAVSSGPAFDKTADLILRYLENRVDSSGFRKAAQRLAAEHPEMKPFLPSFRAGDISLPTNQSFPGFSDPAYSFVLESDYLLLGDRALTTLPLSVEQFVSDIMVCGKGVDEKAVISSELFSAFRRASSCSLRTEREDRALSESIVCDDLPGILSQLEAAQELLVALFQKAPFRKMSAMPMSGEPRKDMASHCQPWDAREFWGQARVRHQGERLIILKFKRSGWTFLLTPIESSMATATILNPLTAIYGACLVSAESAFAKRERDQIASFYKAELPMKEDPWKGLVSRVKRLTSSFNSHMASFWRQGDMTSRWRVAHVGKTGLLGAILALPETDDNITAATRLKRMALGEEMLRKHGDEFNYYPQILGLSATDCPYSRLQAVRWHRLITGAQYSGSALIEKIRLQSAVPAENSSKMGWDPETGVESLTEVSRVFRFLVLRAIERKCTAAAITQASKKAKRVGEGDITDDETVAQGAELMDHEAETQLARLAPAADERPYPAQFSSDMTTPFSARAKVAIPRLPYVEDGNGGPVAPLLASFRIEETVKTNALGLLDRMGMCAEYRCWYKLLQRTDALLQTGWDSSVLQMQGGIKQGAVESPAFFSFLAECCLHETATRYKWTEQPNTFEGLELDSVLYMDDGVQWCKGVQGLEQRIAQWATVLQEYGLMINPKKCQLYCSPFHRGARHIRIQGVEVRAADELHVLGLTFKVGITPSEMLAPLITKTKSKFWGGLRHMLRAKTPLKGRMQMMERILGGTVLWPLAALPMDSSSLGLINNLQLQITIWIMKVCKRSGESWWSTLWLERWWSYAGHRTRHIFPKLMNMERDMDEASLQDKIGDALIGEPDHCPLSINMMGLAGQPQTGPPPDTSCRGKKDCASWDRLRAPHRLGRPPAVPPPDRRVMYPECIPDYMIQGYDKKTDHGYNMIGGPNQVAHWGTGGCIPEATPQTQDGETEEISMVQTLPTNNAWYAFLKALRDKLEGMPCEEKIQDRWFGDEGLLLYAQEEPEGSNKRAEAGPSEPGTRRRREAAQTSATCKPDEETEESSHLALTLAIQAVVTQATWEGRAREYESLEVRLARDQLGRLRREGWTLREQASALYVLVQARNDGDYSDHFPTMMMELDLPVDVNLSPSCLPAACPVLTWIEAEMWDRFVDWFEGMIGAETESLQRISSYNQPKHTTKEQVTPSSTFSQLLGEHTTTCEEKEHNQGRLDDWCHGTSMLSPNLKGGVKITVRAAARPPVEMGCQIRRALGSRGPGEYQQEPSNAILKRRQNEARLLMQVHDDHLRSLETVEVEVEGDGGLFAGLHRRIRHSLYLSSARGAQLQATLVATGGSDIHQAEICDTEDNDQALIEQWWEGLKQHMDLGGTDSEDQHGRAEGALALLADPRHSAEEVEQWEHERQALAADGAQDEQALAAAGAQDEQLRAREAEEAEQERLDEQLYEVHAASNFRDWEAWLVLNTPNVKKRRRLQVALQAGAPTGETRNTALTTASMEIPSGSTDYHIVMHMTQVEEPVQVVSTGAKSSAPEGPAGSSLDINDGVFDRAFSAWKRGELGSDQVKSIFGEDWLFLFQITKDGIEGDTMPPPPLPHRTPHGSVLPQRDEAAEARGEGATGNAGNLVEKGTAPTQVDSGEGVLMQGAGTWSSTLTSRSLIISKVWQSVTGLSLKRARVADVFFRVRKDRRGWPVRAT
ncbi:unnamed protein product, partial [Symbiodinium sp. KB8]